MASAFPHRPPVDHTPRSRRDIVVDSDEQTDVLQSLSSETAQTILATLSEEPTTPSAIADTVDTSLQNVQYHLDRLSDAGLVEPVDTWYSAKGKGMTVYALAVEELVVQFGRGGRQPSRQSPELTR